jgi:hypothetical protein
MNRRFVQILTLFVIVFVILAGDAYADRITVLEKGGPNDALVVRPGDGKDPQFNLFRMWYKGEHNTIMIFNSDGDTATLPKDYFSPLVHTQRVASITDFDEYVWETCIYADASENATIAAHTQNTKTALKATNADKSVHGVTGVHALTSDFSLDGYPAKAGLYETQVWDSTGLKWIPAATVPVKTTPSSLYLYDKDGKEIVGDNTKAV